VLEAPPSNLKLTTPFDLTVAEAVLAARRAEARPAWTAGAILEGQGSPPPC